VDITHGFLAIDASTSIQACADIVVTVTVNGTDVAILPFDTTTIDVIVCVFTWLQHRPAQAFK
jgi:hypothetical protein